MSGTPSAYCPTCFVAFDGDPERCPNLACRRARPRSGWLRMLSPGDILDRNYQVIALVAVGGAGVTYRARELDAQGRPKLPDLAIKVLHSRRSSGAFLQRLANEARILQGLQHDHIVECLGFSQRAGAPPYLVTRFERGGTLQDWVQRHGRLPPWTVAGVLRQVFEGLSAAHAKGVVHRDLKPANLLLAHSVAPSQIPHVRIADFGIAKVTGKLNEGLTRVGAFIGTPRYAAPEQFVGAPATSATDVFAAGALAVELLTGSPWLDEPDAVDLEEWHEAVQSALPPGLPEDVLRSGRARQLLALIEGAMHADPNHRWSTAEVIDYLDYVLGIRATPPARVRRTGGAPAEGGAPAAAPPAAPPVSQRSSAPAPAPAPASRPEPEDAEALAITEVPLGAGADPDPAEEEETDDPPTEPGEIAALPASRPSPRRGAAPARPPARAAARSTPHTQVGAAPAPPPARAAARSTPHTQVGAEPGPAPAGAPPGPTAPPATRRALPKPRSGPRPRPRAALRARPALPPADGHGALVPRRAPDAVGGAHSDDAWKVLARPDRGGGADLDQLVPTVDAVVELPEGAPAPEAFTLPPPGPIDVLAVGAPLWAPQAPVALPRTIHGGARDLMRLFAAIESADRPAVTRLLVGIPSQQLDAAVRAYRPGDDPALGRGVALTVEVLARREWEPVARSLLSDPEPGVRCAAAAALTTVGEDVRSIETLTNLLADPSAEVRVAAVRGMAACALRSGRTRAAAYVLRRALDDPDPRVHDAADIALVDLE